MSGNYEAEQKELTASVAEAEEKLGKLKQNTIDLRMLLGTLREITEIKELNREIINRLIKRIEVHNNDKSGGHCFVKVDIYFTGAGIIDIPTEQELVRLMDEIREEKGMIS